MSTILQVPFFSTHHVHQCCNNKYTRMIHKIYPFTFFKLILSYYRYSKSKKNMTDLDDSQQATLLPPLLQT